ncbi:MAG: KilA-N domain-containing protein [Tannerellaceae bacterium]|jgi:hypothetical protein|nr:KilA-N domain-containing protein [Tannerellaceae bacterium]
MKTAIFTFNEKTITFTLDKDGLVMVNATEMAKIFDEDINHFTRLDGTRKFIEACLKTPHLGFLDEESLIISRQKTGTFMHRILAIKFAAWLDPYFEVWIYSTIDKLMFGKYVEREKSLERTISLQKEMNTLASKPEKSGDDFERYLSIEHELRKEQSIRKNLTRESVAEMADMFEIAAQS